MSDNNCCSETYSSPFLRNSCCLPVTSPSALHSTEVSCGDAPCSPSSNLVSISNTVHDNCHGPCSEHTIQSTSCERVACNPSVCSPIVSGVSGSHQESSCFPITSCGSSLSRLAFCRQPLRCHLSSYQSYGYQPLGYLTYGGQPLSYLSYDRQLLRYHSYGCQPPTCTSDYYRPLNYTCSNFQPYSSSLSYW
uniref:Keratin-associated protein n=1 Tax=Castor canadensis TaxID=51338 RepID=A0A8B7TMY9_CASCN|nr:keratin-associated protein 10-6-like [Castor canadensis]